MDSAGGHISLMFIEMNLNRQLEILGYKAAGLDPNPSLKVFNEYNPNNDAQFAMSWGDFRDDIWTLNTM